MMRKTYRIYQHRRGTVYADASTGRNAIEIECDWFNSYRRRYKILRRHGVSAELARAVIWDSWFDAYLHVPAFTSGVTGITHRKETIDA